MKKKSGFTLVELLAVIVILAVILIIAVPQIMNTIEESRNGALISSAKLVAASAETMKITNETLGITDEIKCEDVANFNEEDYAYCNIKFDENGEAEVTLIGKGKFLGQYVCSGTKNTAEATKNECDISIPKDVLEEIHEFVYYSSLSSAVNDVNNAEIGKNAIEESENAVVGVYTNNGNVNLVLLKDSSEEVRIEPKVDMNINLAGHVFTSNNTVAFNIISGDITFDGRIDGSEIKIIHDDAKAAFGINVAVSSNSNIEINGGSYTSSSLGSNSIAINANDTANIKISNAKITANGTTAATRGIGVNDGAVAEISNCEIVATATDTKSIGVFNSGTTTISNSDVKGYSNYKTKETGDSLLASSYGLYNSGTLNINDIYAFGVQCGINNAGVLNINGGTYEGYGNGGIYFGGENKTIYVRNATIKETSLPEGYVSTKTSSNAGFYVGGSSKDNNTSIYIDKCDIYGSKYSFVLRGSGGEQNNSVYISNSTINTDAYIRIDNDTHKLYIGSGNNFTADNTDRKASVVTTSDIYIND